MLTANNITYKVGNKTLLNDVSVTFTPGKINMIIGPNGAGKSTLIKVLCNQIRPQQGSVTFGKIKIQDYTNKQLGQIRAVLSQNLDLSFPLQVWEVVMMGRYPHYTAKPLEKDQQACEAAMRFFDVYDMAERNYMTLSGGEKQRVHFARVMAQIWYPVENSCRYLIMDEPLNFLDVHYQFEFMHQLVSLIKTSDIVVVGVLHELNLTAKFADQITLINNGEILVSGTKREVFTKENIKKAYRLDPFIIEDTEKDSLHLFF